MHSSLRKLSRSSAPPATTSNSLPVLASATISSFLSSGLTCLGLSVVCLPPLLMTGCGISSVSNNAVSTSQGVAIAGEVYGGALPVNGARVYLFAANTGGFAGSGITASTTNASISLLKSGSNTAEDTSGDFYVTTGASGGFSITGDYSACTAGQQLYLYAAGGNAMGGDPTKTGGINGTNAAIGMLAALGDCSTITSSTVVHLNEVSTIAAAYALAGFATDATHIADDEAVATNTTQGTAKTGMANAFLNVSNLVSPTTGAVLSTTPAGNGTVPTDTLNTLANILADCVQSASSRSGPCSDLFTFTGTSTTADTATAAINLAHNPAGVSGSSVSVTKLFSDLAPNTAFVPNLSSAPNDFTIAISLGNADKPIAIAVHSNGDIWTANSSTNTVSRYNASTGYGGAAIPTANAGFGNNGITLDTSENIWMSSSSGKACYSEQKASQNWDVVQGGVNVCDPTSSGATSYSGNSFNDAAAFDGLGNAWFAQNQSSPETIGTSYVYVSTNAYGTLPSGSSTDIAAAGIAIDSLNDVWIGLTNGIAQYAQNASYQYTDYPDSMISSITSLAIDSGNNIWVTSRGNNSVVEYPTPYNSANFGTSVPNAPLTGGGLNAPSGIAMDGAGTAWVSNLGFPSISAFSTSGTTLSPSKGFTGTAGKTGGTTGPLTKPEGIAVDGSGNVWVVDNNNVTVMYVGLGVPVVTPTALAVSKKKLGTRP